MDQTSIYLMSKRGPKDTTIAQKGIEKQTRKCDMVEIVANRFFKSSCFMFSCLLASNNQNDR